jgi:hypothetical protein
LIDADAGFDAKDFKQNPLDESEWFYQGDKSRAEVY